MPEAGRVITGSAGGLRLDAPGPGTRPLSDRVKQALFSLLEAERPDVWGHPFLDLFSPPPLTIRLALLVRINNNFIHFYPIIIG